MVGRLALDQVIKVRILSPKPILFVRQRRPGIKFPKPHATEGRVGFIHSGGETSGLCPTERSGRRRSWTFPAFDWAGLAVTENFPYFCAFVGDLSCRRWAETQSRSDRMFPIVGSVGKVPGPDWQKRTSRPSRLHRAYLKMPRELFIIYLCPNGRDPSREGLDRYRRASIRPRLKLLYG